MPIQIQLPTVGGPFGPGMIINATVDEPIAIGDPRWLVYIRNSDNQIPILENFSNVPAPPAPLRAYFMTDLTNTQRTLNLSAQLVAGQQVEVHVEIANSSITQVGASRAATFDPTTGLGFQAMLMPRANVQGGFTTQDRQMLTDIQGATIADFTNPQLPLDAAAVPLTQLPWRLPVGLSERVGPFDLTGRGSLSLLPPANHGIWEAIRWFFTVVPDGFGFTPGAVDEYTRRMLQITPVYVLGSSEEIADPIIDATQSGGYFQFPVQPGLERLEYQVPPGVTVSLFLYRVRGT